MLQLGGQQLGAKFELRGARKLFFGALNDGGKIRPVTGFLTRGPTPSTGGHTQEPLLAHTAAMLLGDAAVTLDPAKPSGVSLPAGSPGRDYVAALTLKKDHGRSRRRSRGASATRRRRCGPTSR